MAAVKNHHLAIATEPAHDRATVVVRCDVAFTTFEVNAMNRLGLRYVLRCSLADMDMLYPDSAIHFEEVYLPRTSGGAMPLERVEFAAVAKMRDLHLHIFGKDPISALFVLTNAETGAEVTTLSDVIRVDLAV